MANCYNKIKDCIFCNDQAIYPNPYNFSFNGNDTTPDNSKKFQSNFVRTAKYTLLTFFPSPYLYHLEALILQFKRLANVYFLIIAILQTIPVISPLTPLTAWVPLIVVIGISMIREGFEDYQRYKSDRELNYQSETLVQREGKSETIKWCEVVVGDVCYVQAQEMFPADLILLASSAQGAAFIQTASLDGEKNLKPRNAFKQTIPYNGPQKLSQLIGQFYGIIPDKQLHKFSSKMVINDKNIIIEGDKQLLYRGTRLKNTKWIYGLTIYTGKNTKIMMNSDLSVQKMSQIETKVNQVLGLILIFQLILSIGVGISYGVFRNINEETNTYINWPSFNVPLDSFLISLTQFILINTMIPISLVVSMQFVKTFQKYFINSDKLMYSSFRNKGAIVKSASLNQQLGQIQYVFSDKTGTLTMNIMEFKIAVVGTKMFGDLSLIAPDPNNQGSNNNAKGFYDNQLLQIVQNPQNSPPLLPELTIKSKDSKSKDIIIRTLGQLSENYLLALSLAHEVVAETDKKGNKFYQGPSPDEITLVDAAKTMQFQFIKATQSKSHLKIRGIQKQFQLLETFSFTSDRKRMSVIIRDPKDKLIKMFTKGADNIVKQRLAPNQSFSLDDELYRFSSIGLRTLLIAMRVISEDQYSQFKNKVQKLPAVNREQPMNQLISQLQTDLYLIGATAVLDRLQDNVPETIRDLIRANIKVWMLTGDKMQTAENIAKSCNLIQVHFSILRYVPPKDIKQNQAIRNKLKQLVAQSQKLSDIGKPKGLLIQGGDLTPILKDSKSRKQLANLAKNCQAVVCCRLLPSQKAEVVQVVRENLQKITLSIGDGANDIPMIKSAHIGIGLFGEQGMGAVQASDYALPEFQMLWRLLLVHGRWSYIRISQMVLYFFYKNMLFTLPQFLFTFFCAFSGQTLYDDFYITFYNLVFTSLPLIVRAILQQDVNYIQPKKQQNLNSNVKNLKTQEQFLPSQYKFNKNFYKLFPKIYFIGQQNCIFNFFNYIMWMIQGIIQGTIIFVFSIYILGNFSLNQDGINSDFWIIGLITYSSIILVVTFKLATHTRFWSSILIICVVFLSLGSYAAYMWISNFQLFPQNNVQFTTFIAWTSAETYFVVLFCVCLILALDGFIVFLDFSRGGYASKMRRVVDKDFINNKQYYDRISLAITENLSAKPQEQQ